MNFQLSPGTADALELSSLFALLAQRAVTDLGREHVQSWTLASSEEELQERRRCYSEVEKLVLAGPLVPSLEVPIRPLLEELDAGGYRMGGLEIAVLGDLMAAGASALRRIRDPEAACPALLERYTEIEPLGDLAQVIRRTFDSRGEIREDATPRLTALRGKIRTVRQHAYNELGSIVEQAREHLSEDTIPLRGGRLVLMLRSGARGKVPGLVHGRSQSGQSFYLEPLAAVELNNDLQQAVEDEEAERRRILQDLINRLRDALPSLEEQAELVRELDGWQAVVRFAQVAGAKLAELAPRHDLVLREARHPLLDPKLASWRQEALGQTGHEGEVVGLDLHLDRKQRAIVVTGPNAGGKTVALKTLGILAAAHQAGLPIPATAGTRLPTLSAIVATVGDEQDLLTDRSTFSGRLLRLREAWEAASPDALILLDELGSGTDPEEGAALSIALLESLVERQSLVFTTTHLSQVAARTLDLDGALCAAMEFDPETGRPTFQLRTGPPGGSEALALARRLGLPNAWLDRAEELTGSEHQSLRRLLTEVDTLRQELHREKGRLKTELDDAAQLRERLANEEKELVQERRRIGKTLKKELEAFRDETRKKLRQELQRLEGKVKEGRRKGLVVAAEERLFEEAPALVAPEEEDVLAQPVLGGRVRHRLLGWEGVLEKLERGRAQVRVDGKVLRCQVKDLGGLAAVDKRPKKKKLHANLDHGLSGSGASDDSATSLRELHLIGQRVEPALKELERYLDQAMLESHDEVRIVHGFGSGKLRRAVRDALKGHPAIASWRPGRQNEGGDGATLVQFKS